MNNHEELNNETKDREKERISNLRLTIKQLGDQVTKDELIISELKEKVKDLENSKTGLELQLSSYAEKLNKLRETKVLNVVDYADLENITNKINTTLKELNKSFLNSESILKNSSIGQASINIKDNLATIEELQFKIDDLKDQLYEQSVLLDKKQLELDKKENIINSLEYELKGLDNMKQDIELAKHMLKEKDDTIEELVIECDKWNKYLERIEKNYNFGIIAAIISNLIFVVMLILKG